MHDKPRVYGWRLWFIIFILGVATAGIVWRLIDLTIIQRQFLQKQGNARSSRTITLPAHRGMIYDRHGEPLAISTPVESIWISPLTFQINREQIQALSKYTGVTWNDLKQKLSDNKRKGFIYVKRAVPPERCAKIKALHIPGVHFLPEYKRFYPEGEVTAQVVGFTNIDDKGQEGMELAYNDYLQGVPGHQAVVKDRLGRIVEVEMPTETPKPGSSIKLSIDRRIQYIAYRELAKGVNQFNAEAGTAVVVDVNTGELLAVANFPSFNPNQRQNAPKQAIRNRAATDVFEPGSTLKVFSLLTALESGIYTANSEVDTAPGYLRIEGKRFEEQNRGMISLPQVLKYSSDIGIMRIVLSLPNTHSLWATLHKLGFGELTNSTFPGERMGFLEDRSQWRPLALATLSFGYGMNATALQLAQAYNVIATGGVKYPLTLMHQTTPPSGERVVDEKIAKQLLAMMSEVVQKGGTAPLAAVPGYTVSGKTGTARRLSDKGYIKQYNSSFIGIAPASHPTLLIAVVLYDLQGKTYYGGHTAAPIFSQIMGDSLRLLNIEPDIKS